MVVVLPAPLAPTMATNSPSATSRSIPYDRYTVVPGMETLYSQDRVSHSSSPSRSLHPRGEPGAKVGRDDLLILHYLLWVPSAIFTLLSRTTTLSAMDMTASMMLDH